LAVPFPPVPPIPPVPVSLPLIVLPEMTS